MYYNVVRRNVDDSSAIFFEWTSDSANISGQRSINGGAYSPLAGAISFERSEGSSYLYRIDYSPADRPITGTAEYKLTDGNDVRIIPLSIDLGAQGSGGGGPGGSCDTDAIVDGVLQGLNNVVVIESPLSPSGQITGDIIIGDDYLAAYDRAFVWKVTSLPGVSAGTVSTQFGAAHPTKGSFIVDGDITDNGDDTWSLVFDVLASDTIDCREGEYEWSVQLTDSQGKHITKVRNDGDCYRVTMIEKQT